MAGDNVHYQNSVKTPIFLISTSRGEKKKKDWTI